MTPNPILKVLSTFSQYSVKHLLIGGQACIIYGAAEFSRDSDFVILCSPRNLERLRKALARLKAENIYVPPLEANYLNKGHACHFRCQAEEVKGLRIDVISKIRGCRDFKELWQRRKTVSLNSEEVIEIIGLADLIQSKKTQRDKDWLMLKQLVDNDIILNRENPSHERIQWWFCECRDGVYLIELAKLYPKIAKDCASKRKLLPSAIRSDERSLLSQLKQEEAEEREKDIRYWEPLKRELERLRRQRKIIT